MVDKIEVLAWRQRRQRVKYEQMNDVNSRRRYGRRRCHGSIHANNLSVLKIQQLRRQAEVDAAKNRVQDSSRPVVVVCAAWQSSYDRQNKAE